MPLICFTLSNIGSFSFNQKFRMTQSQKGDKLNYGHKKNYSKDDIELNEFRDKSYR